MPRYSDCTLWIQVCFTVQVNMMRGWIGTDKHSSQGAQVVHLGVAEISAAVASHVAAVVS